MTQIPVSGTVASIFPFGVQPAQTIYNSSTTVTVYIAEHPSITTVSGFPLAPSSSITWDGNRALFALCAPTQTATLIVLENAGGIFNPASIASQIRVVPLPTMDALAWPCISGETKPPTFAGAASGYEPTQAGMAAVYIGFLQAGGATGSVRWSYIGRYSGEVDFVVVTGRVYITTQDGPVRVGFGTPLQDVSDYTGFEMTGVRVITLVRNGVAQATLSPALSLGWHFFQFIITPATIRLMFDGAASVTCTGIGDVAATWNMSSRATAPLPQKTGFLSSLAVTYPSASPL